MKKIIPLILGLFILLPVTNAFAYEGGLLHGQTLKVGKDINTTLTTNSRMTDGILNTVGNVGITTSGFSTVHYKFTEPVKLEAYQLLGDNGIVLSLYDSSGQRIYQSSINTDGTKRALGPVSNVSTVSLTQNGNSVDLKVYEFDVFGDASGPIVANPISNLSESHTHNTAQLSWVNPISNGFDGVVIKKNGVEVVQLANSSSNYSVSGLDAETSYNFEVIAKYSDGSLSTGKDITVLTDVKPVDITAPTNISNVSVVKTHESANFLYVLPVDTDFSHLEVFRDGKLIQDNLKDTNYHDFGLVANTSYVYKFVSVDLDGNKSSGYVQSVLTDSETDSIAPDVPKGITGVNANAAGRISWSRNSESDISGYNLYVDGVKYNTSLILASNYTINGLQNGTSYTITVSAVDTSDNESEQSSPVTLNPSESEMPIFSSKFDLKDVADGTNNWFMSLWPILAFSVGITLAFIVARRVKLLFFA